MFVVKQCLTQRLGLAADVVVDAVSSLGVAVLTARLDVQLVHAPVVQIIDPRFDKWQDLDSLSLITTFASSPDRRPSLRQVVGPRHSVPDYHVRQ